MYDPRHKTLAIVKYDNSRNFDVNKLNTRLAQVKRIMVLAFSALLVKRL